MDWRRPYIDARVKAVIPQFANKLPPLEIYYIDAGILNNPATRFSSNRWVDPNRTGASFDYYSCPQITGDPLQGCVRQNAVSFWDVNDAELRYDVDVLGMDTSHAAGWCLPSNLELQDSIGFQVPEINSRICIWVNALISYWRLRQGTYYFLHPNDWDNARNQMIPWIMQHESGHSVAMPHDTLLVNKYMYPFIPVQSNRLLPNYGIFFPNGPVIDYSDSSKSNFTIVPKEP